MIELIINIALIVATAYLISFFYQFGEKNGRREGFLNGWYFRHKKDGWVPDEVLEIIVPLPCTRDFGNLVDPSAIGAEEIKALFRWMVDENPKIGMGRTFNEYANQRTDLNGLLEYIECRKNKRC